MAARSGLSTPEAAAGMETGSGGNASLRRLAGAEHFPGAWTLGGLLGDVNQTMELAERFQAPAISFELARQLTLSLIDRHGADCSLLSLVAVTAVAT